MNILKPTELMVTHITTTEEAQIAVDNNVEIVGVIPPLIPSNRAAEIGKVLRPTNTRMALVTKGRTSRDIIAGVNEIGPDYVRLIEVCEVIGNEDIISIHRAFPHIEIIVVVPVEAYYVQFWKLKRVSDVKELAGLERKIMNLVGRYLRLPVARIELDTWDPIRRQTGGTGRTHLWGISIKVADLCQNNIPFVLAGGLNRFNLDEALRFIQPDAINVSDGVKLDGSLDSLELRDFRRGIASSAIDREREQRLGKSGLYPRGDWRDLAVQFALDFPRLPRRDS